MSKKSALESNIEKLSDYAETNKDLTPELKTAITRLIKQYGTIKKLGGEDMNKNLNGLEKEVSVFMTTIKIGPMAYDGGRRRKSTSSSSRPRGSRSSKQRSTQRKQKRRRGSRRA